MPFPDITVTQQFDVTITPVTRTGKPAPVDGDPVWASSNEAAATVIPKPGTLSATVVAQAVGDYSISASVDADLGAGVTTIVGVDSGVVTQGIATAVGLTAGPITEQP